MYSAAPVDKATGHSLRESYPSTEMQSVYSAAPANWAIEGLGKYIHYRSNSQLTIFSSCIIPGAF